MANKEISEFELLELADKIDDFELNPVWHHIFAYMQRIYADAAEDALNNPDKGIEVAKASGRAEAIRLITNFKENIPVLKAAMKVAENGRRNQE